MKGSNAVAQATKTGPVFVLDRGLHAGPISYEIGGKQFLVVAPGGHARLGSKLGDYVIAYAVPSRVVSQTATAR